MLPKSSGMIYIVSLPWPCMHCLCVKSFLTYVPKGVFVMLLSAAVVTGFASFFVVVGVVVVAVNVHLGF